ncbi:glucosaminidase domain-containing protein [Cohnella sp. AR92]|uniref:glucosaminidase domain-containing protein n=1 Tax=Cohnella sp. AR92 TaxID=648716 RepID=UPI0013159A28|nr:glucosaminidase domain-containing protein [Cohnella sp. AR92]
MRISLQEFARIGLYAGSFLVLFLILFALHSPSVSAAAAAPAAPAAEAQSSPAYTSYVTTASYLNVRAAPNTRSKILKVVKKGTVLSVTGKLDNGWLQLESKGYVHGGYAIPKNSAQKVKALSYSPVSKQSAASSGSPGDAQTDSGLTVEAIEDLFDGTGFENQGLEEAVLQVEDKYGINAYFTIAVMRLESGNGTSRLAKTRNNLFGLNSSNGYVKFASKEACILRFGELISSNYLGKGYTTIDKIGKKYCPANSKWASLVKSYMKSDYRSTA